MVGQSRYTSSSSLSPPHPNPSIRPTSQPISSLPPPTSPVQHTHNLALFPPHRLSTSEEHNNLRTLAQPPETSRRRHERRDIQRLAPLLASSAVCRAADCGRLCCYGLGYRTVCLSDFPLNIVGLGGRRLRARGCMRRGKEGWNDADTCAFPGTNI